MQTAVLSTADMDAEISERSDRNVQIKSKDVSEILDPLVEKISTLLQTANASCIVLRENGKIEKYRENEIIETDEMPDNEYVRNIISRVTEIFSGSGKLMKRHYGVIPDGIRYLAGIGKTGHPKHNPPIRPDEHYVLLALS